jgi:hypothetical protein
LDDDCHFGYIKNLTQKKKKNKKKKQNFFKKKKGNCFSILVFSRILAIEKFQKAHDFSPFSIFKYSILAIYIYIASPKKKKAGNNNAP